MGTAYEFARGPRIEGPCHYVCYEPSADGGVVCSGDDFDTVEKMRLEDLQNRCVVSQIKAGRGLSEAETRWEIERAVRECASGGKEK